MQIYVEMSKEDVVEAINTYLSKNITLNSDEQFLFDESTLKPIRVVIGSEVETELETHEEEATSMSLEEEDDPPFEPDPEPQKKNLFGGLANLK